MHCGVGCVRVCMYLCVRGVCMSVCVCVCRCVCVYVWMCVCCVRVYVAFVLPFVCESASLNVPVGVPAVRGVLSRAYVCGCGLSFAVISENHVFYDESFASATKTDQTGTHFVTSVAL